MIALQKFERSDYERLISWIDDAESLMQFAGPHFTFPLTAEQLTESLRDKNRHAFRLLHLEKQEVIGHAEIYAGEQTAHLGRIIIGDKNLRGQGLGRLVVHELLKLVFLTLDKPRAELNVFDWNAPAIKCYAKAGFIFNPDKKFERSINSKSWIALNMFIEKEKFMNRLLSEETTKHV